MSEQYVFVHVATSTNILFILFEEDFLERSLEAIRASYHFLDENEEIVDFEERLNENIFGGVQYQKMQV
jgi:hypothetical protein